MFYEHDGRQLHVSPRCGGGNWLREHRRKAIQWRGISIRVRQQWWRFVICPCPHYPPAVVTWSPHPILPGRVTSEDGGVYSRPLNHSTGAANVFSNMVSILGSGCSFFIQNIFSTGKIHSGGGFMYSIAFSEGTAEATSKVMIESSEFFNNAITMVSSQSSQSSIYQVCVIFCEFPLCPPVRGRMPSVSSIHHQCPSTGWRSFFWSQ